MKPLLTPKQQEMMDLPMVKLLSSKFDLQPFSSPEGIKNLEVHHRVQNILATASQSPPVPKPDLSRFAPPSILKEIHPTPPEPSFPIELLTPGYVLNSAGKRIFDSQWKQKNIHPTELPLDHPDYSPF